jgi:hypothetical protein
MTRSSQEHFQPATSRSGVALDIWVDLLAGIVVEQVLAEAQTTDFEEHGGKPEDTR